MANLSINTNSFAVLFVTILALNNPLWAAMHPNQYSDYSSDLVYREQKHNGPFFTEPIIPEIKCLTESVAINQTIFWLRKSKKGLPPSPRKCVYIKSVFFKEYLYTASEDLAYDKNNFRVFTWGKKEDGRGCEWGKRAGYQFRYQALWVLVPAYERNQFTIRSAYYDNEEMLYALDDAHSEERRPVMVWRSNEPADWYGGKYVWELEFVPGHADRVRIKNAAFDEYLYPAVDDLAYDKERRNVYTWKNQTTDIDSWKGQGDWILETGECKTD